MKIRYGWLTFCAFVVVYVLICISLQLALWREELLHVHDEVRSLYLSRVSHFFATSC